MTLALDVGGDAADIMNLVMGTARCDPDSDILWLWRPTPKDTPLPRHEGGYEKKLLNQIDFRHFPKNVSNSCKIP